MDISKIKDPKFLKDLKTKELVLLAKDIREFLILHISKNGGHLSSNLGVVELTIALEKEFDLPNDKIVFDVGHQSYVHKILTGRANEFDNLRKYNGLSGFPDIKESIYDSFSTGHASTSISAVSGFLLNNDKNYCISVIGDGALAGGEAFEGLNYLGKLKTNKGIVVLNDNNASIRENAGGCHELVVKIRGRKITQKIKKVSYKILPLFLIKFNRLINKFFKMLVNKKNYFEYMGFNYVGVVDGNDFKSLKKAIKIAKSSKKPTVIHILTKNGKGYSYAENNKEGLYHGVSPFRIDEGVLENKNKVLFSQAICDSLIELKKNMDIKVIVPAMVDGSRMNDFLNLYPSDLVDVGITEEHAITMATSASLNNNRIFLPIYSTFLQRAYDQLLHDASRHNTNIVIGVDRAGLNPNDGETHQGIYDISYLKTIPNTYITCPSNIDEAYSLLSRALDYKGIFVIRYAKTYLLDYKKDFKLVDTTKWIIEKESKNNICVISYGRILNTIKELDLDVTLVNALIINPIDSITLKEIVKDNKKIIIYEDVIDEGSLANSVIIYLKENDIDVDVIKHNIGNTFAPCGSIDDLDKLYKLDSLSIKEEIDDEIRLISSR